jgi:hypothetical protein
MKTGRFLTVALAIFALVVMPLAIYAAGYVLLSERLDWHKDMVGRIYDQAWLVTAFWPARRAEELLTGKEVSLISRDEFSEWRSGPPIIPPTPAPIIHIADWHWSPVNECNDTDNRELVEEIQQQQMDAIRKLGVRQVWVEGQSDQTIAEFREHIRKLRDVRVEGDSPVDQLIRDLYQEDLLQIGAAGRLLLQGEIDDVLPLEDHDAWQAAKPVDCERNINADPAREQAMANRLPPGAVIVLGMGHDLSPYLFGDTVEVIPRRGAAGPAVGST